jgi:peptidoglycan-associated lipoprotein
LGEIARATKENKMKLSKFANVVVIGLTLTIAVSGCKKKPGVVTPLPSGMTHNPNDLGPGEKIPGGNTGETNLTGSGLPMPPSGVFDNWPRDETIFKQDTVYFAYDSAVVRAVEKSKVAKVADYLKSNAANALEVDGHCDERGTEEYNRSLGERRAISVREELARLGVDPSKVVTKTFGKDRPIEPLHAESAWSKNRRAEFILLTPPK